jgi:hypothetical protein
MKCSIVLITREPQDCIENKCYIYEIYIDKCRWLSTKWINGFVKNVVMQWHSMEDFNSYITAIIFFANSIRHSWQEKDDEDEWLWAI